MAFKCYCAICKAPLYFEDSMPMPQVCGDCMEVASEADERADNGRNTGGKSYYRPSREAPHE